MDKTAESLTKDRMCIHQIAELGFEEYKTKKYILSILKNLNCKIFEIGTGVIAYFCFNKPNTVAIRCEMDALPILEKTRLSFASTNGNMHACGHDGHMAICLGLCRFLHGQKDEEICYNVAVVFQPAEETFGGAVCICESQVLQNLKVKKMYGLHLWRGEKGKLYACDGIMMASSDEVQIVVSTDEGHIGQKENADALKTACKILLEIYNLSYSYDKTLIRFGKIGGGTAGNVICSKVTMFGSVRSLSPMSCDMMHFFQRLADKYSVNKCVVGVILKNYSCCLKNDSQLFSQVKKKFTVKNLQPVFQAEDFANYGKLLKIPTLFMFLGAGKKLALHTSDFDFDTNVLQVGLNYFKSILLC